MFRRSSFNLPEEPEFEPDLAKLGYRLTDGGEFVKTGKDGTAGEKAGEHFEYFVSDNERYNELHKHAFYDAIQDIILEKLDTLGLSRLFLSGENGTEISTIRPHGTHLNILTTKDLRALRNSRNVIVVVPDSGDELGIWSYRFVTRKPGLKNGSAVGLANMISEIKDKDMAAPSDTTSSVTSAVPALPNDTAFASRGDNVIISAKADPPALIILNPGQLYYSCAQKKPISIRSLVNQHKWDSKGKFRDHHPEKRVLQGHHNSHSHTVTVFEEVLPQLVSFEANLYVVGIGDGAGDFALHLDEVLHTDANAQLAKQVKAFATIQPTFQPTDLTCDATKSWMFYNSRSWVLSALPKTTFLSAPGAYNPITISSDTGVHNTISPADESTPLQTAIQETVDEGVLSTDALEPAAVTDEEQAEYDYYRKEPVSSPTYSSGVSDDAENIWPTVMGNVLDYFRCVAEDLEISGDAHPTDGPVALDIDLTT